MSPDSASKLDGPEFQVLVLVGHDTDISEWEATLLEATDGLSKVEKLAKLPFLEESASNGVWLGLGFRSNDDAAHFMEFQSPEQIRAIRMELNEVNFESIVAADSSASSSCDSPKSEEDGDLVKERGRSGSEIKRDRFVRMKKLQARLDPDELLRVICAHLKFFIVHLMNTTPDSKEIPNIRAQLSHLSSLRTGGSPGVPLSLLDHNTLARAFGEHMATISRARGEQIKRHFERELSSSPPGSIGRLSNFSGGFSQTTATSLEDQGIIAGRPRSKSAARPSVITHFDTPPASPLPAPPSDYAQHTDSPLSARSESKANRRFFHSDSAASVASSSHSPNTLPTQHVGNPMVGRTTPSIQDDPLDDEEEGITNTTTVHSRSASSLSRVLKHSVLRSDSDPTMTSSPREFSPPRVRISRAPSKTPPRHTARESSIKIHAPTPEEANSITRHDSVYQTMKKRERKRMGPTLAEPSSSAHYVPNFHRFNFGDDLLNGEEEIGTVDEEEELISNNPVALPSRHADHPPSSPPQGSSTPPVCSEACPMDRQSHSNGETTGSRTPLQLRAIPLLESIRSDSSTNAIKNRGQTNRLQASHIHEDPNKEGEADPIRLSPDMHLHASAAPLQGPNQLSVHLFQDFSKPSELMEYMCGMAKHTYPNLLLNSAMLRSALSQADMRATNQFGSQHLQCSELTLETDQQRYTWGRRAFSLRKYAWGVYWMLFTRLMDHIAAHPKIPRATTMVELGSNSSLQASSSSPASFEIAPSPYPTVSDLGNLELLWAENVEVLRELAYCRELELKHRWRFELDLEIPLESTDAVIVDKVHRSMSLYIPELKPIKSPRPDAAPLTYIEQLQAQVAAHESNKAFTESSITFLASPLARDIVDINLRLHQKRRNIHLLAQALGLAPTKASVSYRHALTGAMYALQDNGAACTIL